VLARVLVLNLIVVAIKVTVGPQNRRAFGTWRGTGVIARPVQQCGRDAPGHRRGTRPDESHPYGHAKFETLGALAIVTFLSISCFELCAKASYSCCDRTRPDPQLLEVGLIGFTLVVNASVVITSVDAGESSRARSSSRTLPTPTATCTSRCSPSRRSDSRARLGHLDPVLALLCALIIARNGYQILKEPFRSSWTNVVSIRRMYGARREHPADRGGSKRALARGASGVVFAEVTVEWRLDQRRRRTRNRDEVENRSPKRSGIRSNRACRAKLRLARATGRSTIDL
jgi:hypothetical protein